MRMHRVTLARQAMATRFEFVLVGENPVQLRAAGEEALAEIERLDAQLSLYRSSSEIAQLNARAANEWVRLSPPVFELLESCRKLSEITHGLFDVSIAPLVRCWGFMRGSGSRPTDEEISAAREKIGMHLLQFDPHEYAVRFSVPGVMIDLGSIGKGYALEAAAEILRENGVAHALLHGGTSTIYAIGPEPDSGPWKVAIELQNQNTPKVISVAKLSDMALSVSAVAGKKFEFEGQTYGHVINPRTGWPVRNAVLSAVLVDSATLSDAFSTAVLLGTKADLETLGETVPGLNYLQVSDGADVTACAIGFELI